MMVAETWELGQEDAPVIPPEAKPLPEAEIPKESKDPKKKDNLGKALAILAIGGAIGAATLIWVKPGEPYRIFLLSIGGVIAGRGLVELLL